MLRRMIGGLLVLEGLFMIVPILVALYHGENTLVGFITATGAAIVIGLCLARPQVQSTHMGKAEGFLLTTLVWIVFSLFGLLPFMIGPHGVGLSSAFFEAMSSFTTTGATTVPADSPLLCYSIRIWQAMMQWIGGMGIILFTLAIVPMLNSSGGMQMFNAEVTGITKDKLMPRISHTAMALWVVYIVLSAVMALMLWIGPMTLFDSICIAFGTLSTGGFSSLPADSEVFNSTYVLSVIAFFMLCGGLNFANIYRTAIGKWQVVKKDEVARTYIGAIAVFTALFAFTRLFAGNVHCLRDFFLLPLFQVISIITSTGYLAPGFAILTPFILLLTFCMMFSGGCAGSTSGGAKIDRFIYLCKYLKNEVRLCLHPNEIFSVRVSGNVVQRRLVSKVIAFMCLYGICILAGGLMLAAMGLPAVDSLFSSFACLSNTGLGASVTGYGDDYLTIPEGAKWVLSGLMLIGRLEIFTVLVLLSPNFWRR